MISLLSSILMITAGAFAVDEAASAKPQAGKSIAFAIVGPVDSALTDRVV
jgi:hypothetical protein